MNDNASGATPVPTLLDVKAFCQRHSWAREGGIRDLLFRNPHHFREACAVRLGRKILLDEAAVFRWLRQYGGERTEPPKPSGRGGAAGRRTRGAGAA